MKNGKVKINVKDILSLMENIKSLLDGYQEGIFACDDLAMCHQVFSTTNKHVKDLLREFRIENSLQYEPKPNVSYVPNFIKAYNRADYSAPESITRYEDESYEKAKLYFKVKKKLEIDGVDHLNSKEKITRHISLYLIGNDSQLEHYMYEPTFCHVGEAVVEALVNEILDARKRNPQISLDFPKKQVAPNTRLLDMLENGTL